MRSTFAGFTTAQLGLSASQQALNVTGQNITNINTSGYTRQTLDQVSLNLTGYSNTSDARVGYGVLVTGVSQSRDPYLDIRFRNTIAKVGESDVKVASLSELEDVFDEVAKTGLQDAFTDLTSYLNKLSSNAGDDEFDSMVRSSCDSLCQLINQYAKQVEEIRDGQEDALTNVDVPEVNKLMENIATLNKTIRNSQINGNDALELIDQRNTLIDELASYVKIDVSYVATPVSSTLSVDELQINLVGSTGTNYSLVNGNSYGEFTVSKDATTEQLEMSLKDAKTPTTTYATMVSELSTGSLKSSFAMLNQSGTFDTPATDEKGIGYYEQSLDLLAQQIATVFNEINNRGVTPPTENNLFVSDTGATTDITAENLCIASGWTDGTYGINASSDATSSSAVNDNILAMVATFDSDYSYTTSGGSTLFTGTFSEYFSDVGTTLGLDIKSTTSTLENYAAVADEISDSKDAISGVSLDEEGINLLQYQKSYAAAARLMTTLDEALETLLGMGVVGR
ncbi:MAG: flagellar hook-associated protein FlgK [Anaerotignaceae bacterium]